MPFMLTSELAALAGMMPPKPKRGDWASIRRDATLAMEAVNRMTPRDRSVRSEDFFVPVADGGEIMVRWYTRAGERPGSALVYFHGGGMICGSVDLYDNRVAQYAEKTGVPVLSVDYRVAPEQTGTSLVEDGFAALCWLIEQSAQMGVDPERVAVIGDSGGGGVAAGVAIAARDRGVPLARQILLYPMLDDRTTVPDPELEEFAFWSYESNFTGWQALLGDTLGNSDVPPLAVPGRLTDFRGLAPALIDVGELDIFRDESIRYAQGLYSAGISAELNVRPGSPHGFDVMDVLHAKDSWADRLRVISSL